MSIPAPLRFDYAFPLRLPPGSGGAARADYPAHVRQMLRQLLLTSPGERVNLPEFGCGLRALVFDVRAPGLEAGAELLVRRAVESFLAQHVRLEAVRVPVLPPEEGRFEITVEYTLLETGARDALSVEVA